MEAPRRCQNCNSTIDPDAPEGLCPSCLLQAGSATRGASGTAATATDFVPPPVEEIGRRFPQLEVLELIGRGGMSAVYRARQPSLERTVAIKVLPASLAAIPGFAERFAREARALARLNHPNIVAVHDSGRVEDLFYFIMEHVDGSSLRQRIRAGTLSPAEVLRIIPRICEALQYAHDEGVVHRDIKPENILITSRGQVKIADFGIAKLLRPEGSQGLTGSGEVVGTPHYMAPEQVEHPLAVDHRADIYSLGVVFYELLTGELPLGRFSPPSAKVRVDLRVDEVVLKALEKEPERRYQRASEMKSRVETVTGAAAPPAVPPPLAAAPRPAGGGPAAPAPRLCRLPVWGALCAPLGAAAAYGFMAVKVVTRDGGGAPLEPPSPEAMPAAIEIAIMALMVAGCIAPFVSTALGFAGISRIRGSAGRLYGMTLSVAVAVLYPVLIADLILYGLFEANRRHTEVWGFIALAWALAILVLDFLAVRAVYRAATRPATRAAAA